MFPENYEMANNLKWCAAFYDFIKGLLSPYDDRNKEFWVEEKIDFNKIDLKTHKVFI